MFLCGLTLIFILYRAECPAHNYSGLNPPYKVIDVAYKVKKFAEQLTVPVRGLNYRVYRWGGAAADPVFLLHGWADTGMSFQFLADAMPDDWCLVAPDWRGFGGTDWNRQGYWFPDYLADLDVLINAFAGQRPVKLVGHSMGGNVVLLYAGILPDSVSHAITLEQFGLADCDPNQAPGRYARWLAQWRDPPVNLEYSEISGMEERIKTLAPYLGDERVKFLTPYWCKKTEQGKYTSRIDPGHKRVNPVLYRREEAKACWRKITARVMLGLGEESNFTERYRNKEPGSDFKSCFDELHEVIVPRCGHMMHLDQPEQTAKALDEFLRS